MNWLILSLCLLLICVIGIVNGPVGLVVFYEQDVKDRVVKLGLTSVDKIRQLDKLSNSKKINLKVKQWFFSYSYSIILLKSNSMVLNTVTWTALVSGTNVIFCL